MIHYSIIKKSQLEGAHRLDAEYYQPEYLTLNLKLKKQKTKFLENLTRVIKHPAEIKRVYEDSGTPFLLTQNILPGVYTLQFEEKRFITSEDAKRIPQNRLEIGDVVMTRTGANYGDTAVYLGEPKELFASAHVLIIRPKGISGEFLATYLNSHSGRSLVKRGVYGTSQPEISPEYLKTMLIPMPDENTLSDISGLVRLSNQELKNSKSLYSEAENLLLGELGLKDLDIEDDLSYIVNLSEVKSGHRADAEFFQPKSEKIFQKVNTPIKTLSEITSFLNHAKQPPYIEDGEVLIITQRHLGQAFLNDDALKDEDNKFTSQGWLKQNPSYQVNAGDVLYYSVGAYIGKTNVILEPLNATAASFITIIRPREEIDSLYLTVLLNSVIGKLQSGKWQSATAQQYIYPKDIRNFKIPILPKPTQQKIASLVRQSHEARKKAKELLRQAKLKVEELIEQGTP